MVYIVCGENEIVIDMDAKCIILLCFGFFMAFAPVSAAALQTAGEFTCPAGQTENPQCAASCCMQYGGTYSYVDQTCEVAAAADWNSALQCEQQSGCCIASGLPSSSSSSGCCEPAALLGLVLVGAVAISRKRE
jgi:hypothetical protein